MPESDTYPTAGAGGAKFACADHARFLARLPSVSARSQSGFPRSQPLFSPTRFHEDPHFFLVHGAAPAKYARMRNPAAPSRGGVLAEYWVQASLDAGPACE